MRGNVKEHMFFLDVMHLKTYGSVYQSQGMVLFIIATSTMTFSTCPKQSSPLEVLKGFETLPESLTCTLLEMFPFPLLEFLPYKKQL